MVILCYSDILSSVFYFSTFITPLSILYSLFSTLYSLLSILYSLFSTLCSLLSVLYSLFSTLCSLFSTLYSLLSALHSLALYKRENRTKRRDLFWNEPSCVKSSSNFESPPSLSVSLTFYFLFSISQYF